jgi:putative transposase
MPWKETCAVDERVRFVIEVEKGEEMKAALCRRFGISRPTGEKWLRRYAESGLGGLVDRSRAPRRHANQVAEELAELILALRRRHPRWGPKKLRVLLQRRYGQLRWPACSTIGEILRRAGLTVPRKRRRRTPPYTQPFADCRAPNAVWCADFKGWFRTGDGSRCDPLTISDAHSRYLLRLQAMTETRHEPVRALFEATFRQYGLPGTIRTDNGSPFASCGIGGLSRLSVWWLKLGIQPERIEPGEPQQNARHERMHLTLKTETASPPAWSLRRQQQAFDRFRREFNQVRPHEALGQRCPETVYCPSAREYRESTGPVEYPPTMELRSVKGNGVFNWRGQVVFLGEALARERVGVCEVADGCWAVYFCCKPLGIVDERRRKVVDVGQALRKATISESALRSPFRYAPGAPEGPDDV